MHNFAEPEGIQNKKQVPLHWCLLQCYLTSCMLPRCCTWVEIPLALGSSNRRLIIRVRFSQLHVPVQFKKGDKVYAMVDTIQKPRQEGSMPSSTLAVSCMGADLVYILRSISALQCN